VIARKSHHLPIDRDVPRLILGRELPKLFRAAVIVHYHDCIDAAPATMFVCQGTGSGTRLTGQPNVRASS